MEENIQTPASENDPKPEEQQQQAEELGSPAPGRAAAEPESVLKALLTSRKKAKALGWSKKWLVILDVKEWIVSIVFAVVAVWIIKSFLVWPITVDGSSMETTLHEKDKLLVTSYDVRFGSSPRRGDVVICHYYGRTSKLLGLFTVKTDFVKRVVGVPGDTVSRVNGVTYINGSALDPSKRAWRQYTYTKNEDGSISYFCDGQPIVLTDEQTLNIEFDYEYTLGEGEYFVVGDNRYNSHDSRKWNGPDLPVSHVNNVSGSVGPITKGMISGHVRYVFFPFKEARRVENDPGYMAERDR